MISHLLLRLGFWLLLTADTSSINITIGVLVALALPHHKGSRLPLSGLIDGAWRMIKMLPGAYLEAFSLLIYANPEEAVTKRPVGPDRNPWLLLLEIILINFSPNSIALQGDEQQRIHIHHIRRRKRP